MQIGMWFRTRHLAFIPHNPGQGSWQWRVIQASSVGQSELIVHSGLQLGGEPIKSGRHEQSHRSPFCLFLLFNPQGSGSQGSSTITGAMAVSIKWKWFWNPWKRNIRISFLRHVEKGSPTYPGIHIQFGIWFMTLHWAFVPQSPGHGS